MAEFDLRAFLIQRIAALDKNIDTSRKSQFDEGLGRPLTDEFMAGLEAMIQADDVVRDLRKVDQMTFDQVAAVAANWGVEAKTGVFSTGTVTIYFFTPQDFVLNVGTGFTAQNGARFFSTQAVSITQAQMSAQKDPLQGTYRLDIPGVRSTGAGSEFSIKAGDIIAVDGQSSNVAQVVNQNDFSASVAAETKEELAARIVSSASMRNYCSADSTKAVLLQDPRIKAVSPIGAGDVEMIRDILFGGLHTNGMQDTYVYGAEPFQTFVSDLPIQPDFLPAFIFFGRDVSKNEYNPDAEISATPGPIVAIQKVEYGTGSGSGFLPIGTLTAGEDFVYEFIAPGTSATKNSVEEIWKLRLIKRPAAPASAVRVTALRTTLPSILQQELAESGNRAPAQGTLFKAFTVALLDVTAIVRPLPGQSQDPATYTAAIKSLITSTPIAGNIDLSDLIDALVKAGADEVILPISAQARIFYPDLTSATVLVSNRVGGESLSRGPFTERTIAYTPGNISVSIR